MNKRSLFGVVLLIGALSFGMEGQREKERTEIPEVVVLPVYDVPAKESGDVGRFVVGLDIREDGSVSKAILVSPNNVAASNWISLSPSLIPSLEAWKYRPSSKPRKASVEVSYELAWGAGEDVVVYDLRGRVLVC